MEAGILAELETPEALIAAARALRARGYRRIEAFTPYPVKGLDAALGQGRSRLSWLILGFGLLGAGAAYLIQLACNLDYPLDVGGRPLHSAPAFIPITFEMGVLGAALSGVLGFFLWARLPRLHSPLFDVPGFERASLDRFWIGVDERDAGFNPDRVERDLKAFGPLRVARARGRSA